MTSTKPSGRHIHPSHSTSKLLGRLIRGTGEEVKGASVEKHSYAERVVGERLYRQKIFDRDMNEVRD